MSISSNGSDRHSGPSATRLITSLHRGAVSHGDGLLRADRPKLAAERARRAPQSQTLGNAGGPIVCGVDNSSMAAEAATAAARLAHLLGLELILVYVADPRVGAADPQDASIPSLSDHPWLGSAAADAGRRVLSPIERRVRSATTRICVEYGDAQAGLLDVAFREKASVMAIGACGQGGGGSSGLGSLAQRLPIVAPCPVVVAPGKPLRFSERSGEQLTVICGVDGSAGSFRAAVLAADLCTRCDGRLVLVHSCSSSCRTPAATDGTRAHEPSGGLQLLHAIADLVRDRVDVSVKLTVGDPASQLLSQAVNEQAHLLVTASANGPGRRASSLSGKLARSNVLPVILLPTQTDVAAKPDQYQLEAVA